MFSWDDASVRSVYMCVHCRHTWHSGGRYQWWPIRVRWSWASFRMAWKYRRAVFGHHGWQTGHDGLERHVFGQTFHVGPLKMCLGRDLPRHGEPTCPRCKRALPTGDVGSMAQNVAIRGTT